MAFRHQSGPYSPFLLRNGYDVRKHPESRIFQLVKLCFRRIDEIKEKIWQHLGDDGRMISDQIVIDLDTLSLKPLPKEEKVTSLFRGHKLIIRVMCHILLFNMNLMVNIVSIEK